MWDGKIDAAVAQVLARIANPALQVKALEELLNDYRVEEGETISPATARDLVREKYMLVLADAPFARDDARLHLAAGPCTTCPKRTGAQKELFAADESKADLCLDFECYSKKAEALWKRTAAKAEEGGGKVLSEADTKKVFPYANGAMAYGSAFAKLSDRCYEDPKQRTYKAMLGARAKDEVVLARDPSGGVHELVSKASITGLLKEAGHKDAAKQLEQRADSRGSDAERRRKEAKDAARRRAITTAVITEVVRAQTDVALELTDRHWHVFAVLAERRASHETRLAVAKRRGLDEKGKRPEVILRKHLAELPPIKLPAFVLELAVSSHAYYAHSDRMDEGLEAAAKALGVNPTKIRQQVIAAEKPAKKKPARG
jgi:hypothetical protein